MSVASDVATRIPYDIVWVFRSLIRDRNKSKEVSMDESTNDGIVNVGDGNDGGAAMNPATGTEPAAQSTDAYSVTYAAAARLNDAPESAAPASVWDEMSHKPQPGRRCDAREQAGHIRLREAVQADVPDQSAPRFA